MCNRVALVSCALIAAAVLCLTGCGSGASSPWVQMQSPVVDIPGGNGDGFVLSAPQDNAESGGIRSLQLVVNSRQDHVVVQIVSAEYRQFDDLLFELYYDPALYTPLAAQSTEAVAAQANSLNLQILDHPGRLTTIVVVTSSWAPSLSVTRNSTSKLPAVV